MLRKILCAAIIATSLGGISIPTASAAVIIVRTAPPPMREEIVPQPRHGYAWAPGYWNWHNHNHVWVAGKWIRDRPGYRYNASKWEERNGRWQMQRGGWARGDRDGDGVPNRVDRQPDNPRRY